MIARERMMKAVAVCGVAVLLTCSMALGWGRKPVEEPKAVSDSAVAAKQPIVSLMDSFPDAVSYPATSLEDAVVSPEAQRLNALLGDTQDVRREWWLSHRHPFIDSVLPGVNFLVVSEEDWRVWDVGKAGRPLIQGGKKLYPLNALNRVMLDAGFTFDSAEMPTIARTAVLFATFGKRAGPSGQLTFGRTPTDSFAGDGFPAITFLSMKRGERRYRSGYVGPGISADCVIDGARNNVFVEFVGPDRRGFAEPERVMGTGIDFLVTPIVLPDRK